MVTLRAGILKFGGARKSASIARSVAFNTERIVFEIPSLYDFTDSEIQSIWFAKFEYDQIRTNNKILAKMMAAGGYKEDDRYCFRGLEYKTRMGSKIRKNSKMDAKSAVFNEQFRQFEDGVTNEELIKIAYKCISDDCHLRAHIQGRQDAQIALFDEETGKPYISVGQTQHWSCDGPEEKSTTLAPLRPEDSTVSAPLRPEDSTVSAPLRPEVSKVKVSRGREKSKDVHSLFRKFSRKREREVEVA